MSTLHAPPGWKANFLLAAGESIVTTRASEPFSAEVFDKETLSLL